MVVGFLCRNVCSLAYPKYGRGFRAIALCLAKIDPFYWPSDSSSAEIRLLAVLLAVFSSQMQALSQGLRVLCAEMGVAWHLLGAGELSEPYSSLFSQNRAILLAFRLLQY